MIFEINGVNMLPYVAHQGFKWQRNDIESEDAGRFLDGTLVRDRVATKIRLDITCRPLKTNEAMIVLQAVYPEEVTVRYTDPQYGLVTRTMYSNNNPASHMLVQEDGTEWWNGITFPLIEI